jgi:hypothetical protein
MQSAWAWYDQDTFAVKHVGFNQDTEFEKDLVCVEIDFNMAVEIAEGKIKLSECVIANNGDQLEIVHRKPALPIKRFWDLADLEKKNVLFDQAGFDGSPIKILERVATGFTISLLAKITDITFYITMKNDPNYLIRIVDFDPFLGGEEFDPNMLYVETGVEGDYSIYVRYNAA